MVLESIISPFKAENRPASLTLIGFLYATVAIFMALWIFKEQSSLIMVFFAVLACVPLMFNTMKREEKKDLQSLDEISLLREHQKALNFLMFLFLGLTIAFTLWYIILPDSYVATAYSVQTQTILNVNNRVSGDVFGGMRIFVQIFLNNTKVLIFSILFSFIYGMGAIFILTWNASVIGTALGNFIKASLVTNGTLGAIGYGLLRYFIHGIPEIAAYFVGGMAGGIISFALINNDFQTRKFEKILLDASHLVTIAVIFLVVAGLLEVFVTPLFF